MRVERRMLIGAAAAASVIAVLGGALPAAAAVNGYAATTRWIGGGSSVNIRSAPSTSARIVGSKPVGTALSIDCQTTGGQLGFSGYAANRTWDRLTDGTFIHDVVTTTPGGARTNLPDGGYVAWSSTIPRCVTGSPAPAPAPATGAAAALAWAARQEGKTQAAPEDQALFSARDWGALGGEWSGDCPKFVSAAWYRAGKHLRGGDAKVMWALYGNPTNGATRPPAGALVFWKDQSDYGHVALADGNGLVWTTQGMDGDRKPIAHIDLTQTYGQPTGWAMP